METNDKPIIKNFKINGLHGYKNIEIDFDSPVRIVIAENGAGKTTILSALHSFLTGNYHNLRNIDFESISCLFEGQEKSIILTRKDITGNSSNLPLQSLSIQELIEHTDIEEHLLLSFLTSEYDPDSMHSIRNSVVGERLYLESPYSINELHEKLNEANEYIVQTLSDELNEVTRQVKEALGDTEILYLPTYRRIEKLLGSKVSKDSTRHLFRTSQKRLRHKASSNSHMNYGLADVEERLSSLTDEVQRRTNIGYREISANIIDDLFQGKVDNSGTKVSELPDLETLTRFFSRIGGPRQGGVTNLEQIQQLYDEENYDHQNNNITTLRYFLSKLSQVVDQTKSIESTIENFVEKANTYLGSTSDIKSLTYDPENMTVSVVNQWTSKHVKLNDLSSGEKQVVSLLSYLFLYPSKKIILVDEPELSLSIDWQQKILVDMVDAPSCQQLLAITHSPFIFDNKLDCYGSPLKVTRIKNKEVDGVS